MTSRDLALIIISILVGGFCALVVRSALHKPQEPLPVTETTKQESSSTTVMDHATHTRHADQTSQTKESHISPAVNPINTICAICGMDVDAAIPTAVFNGKTIGFACQKCPPLFAKDPELYGPYYLKNEKFPK